MLLENEPEKRRNYIITTFSLLTYFALFLLFASLFKYNQVNTDCNLVFFTVILILCTIVINVVTLHTTDDNNKKIFNLMFGITLLIAIIPIIIFTFHYLIQTNRQNWIYLAIDVGNFIIACITAAMASNAIFFNK